jgi:hypothetical protein
VNDRMEWNKNKNEEEDKSYLHTSSIQADSKGATFTFNLLL